TNGHEDILPPRRLIRQIVSPAIGRHMARDKGTDGFLFPELFQIHQCPPNQQGKIFISPSTRVFVHRWLDLHKLFVEESEDRGRLLLSATNTSALVN
ncbi:hypothetical protein J6590_032265, partial [Homalodisca vitripennis]